MKTTLYYKAARLVIALLGILTLTTSTVWGAMPNQTVDSPAEALVRVDLDKPVDLELVSKTGLMVYAHLSSPSGQEYLLLPASAVQQSRLRELGLTVQILDDDSRQASYYLLYARDTSALDQAGKSVQILAQEGRTVLVKATPEQAESLPSLRVEIKPLNLHPLVLSSQRPTTFPEVIEPDPTIQGMINQVSSATILDYDGGLSGEWAVTIGGEPYTILTRNTGQAIPTEKATQFTYEHFQSLGLPVSYHYYNHPYYGQRRNVVAEQPGLTQPERIFLVTAHVDDMPSGTLAPGADDNASGSVGVMIVADILSQYNFDCTLRYVLFTGEEQGLYGSYYYAQAASNNGDNIEGVLNLDMIAYNSDLYPIIDLHTRPGNQDDLAIANLFVDVVDAYNIGLTPDILQDGIQYSDHASFWEFGYPAILGIEDDDDFTPWYHTTNDRLNTLNLTYFTNYVKAAVGTFAHMGCLLNQGYLTGEVSDNETSAPIIGASIAAQRAAGQPRSTLSGLDGAYTLALPEGTYTVTALADGYMPFTTSGIGITADLTTTLDIQMQPCSISGADFTFAPSNPLSGQTVTFTGTVDASSTAPVSYNWDFGDGHTAEGSVVEHTYTVSDTYTVDMDAQNCAGSSSAAYPVTVTGLPGISVSRQYLDIEAQYSQTVTSTLEIGNSGEKALTWSLAELPDAAWMDESAISGELGPQERQEILLTIQSPLAHGVYTTTLQIQSNDPDHALIDIPVTLEVACTAPQGVSFDISPPTPRIGQPVTFSSNGFSASHPIQYTWNFNDGSETQTGEGLSSVEHSFPLDTNKRIYPVSLSVQNACSAPVQVAKMILVSPYQAYLPLVSAASP
jgi:PKD repeat protein